MLNKIKTFVLGNKTILTALIGALSSVIAWSEGAIDGTALLAALWAAGMMIFTRLGVKKAQEAAETAVPPAQVSAIIRDALNQPKGE